MFLCCVIESHVVFHCFLMCILFMKDDRVTTSSLSSGTYSATGSVQIQPPGTLVSLLRRGLSWPRRASRAVCVLPRRLFGSVCESFTAVGSHVRSYSHDYVFLYELLSLGCPLLCMMHEVLGQIYQEPQLAQQQLTAHQFM